MLLSKRKRPVLSGMVWYLALECLLIANEFPFLLCGNLEALLRAVVNICFLSCGGSRRKSFGTYLGGIQNSLYLLQQTAFVLLQLWLSFHGLLDEKFYVSQFAEIEVALALEAAHSFDQLGVLCLKSGRCRSGRLTAISPRGSCSHCWLSCGSCGTRCPVARHCWWTTGYALPPTDSIVVTARKVLVPVLLRPLHELEVVLHLALDQLLHGDGSVDVVFTEQIAEDFEIVEVGILALGIELDTAHGDIEEDAVVDLAQGGARGED